MTRYAEFYNDQLIEFHNPLPKSWKNISGFCNLSDLELLDLSWSGQNGYKFLRCISEPIPEYDDVTERLTGPYVKIENNTHITYWLKESRTENEIQEIQNTNIFVKWQEIRSQRNELLKNTDWTQLADAPFTPEEKSEYSTYRQALRDITVQSDPFNISWPSEPVI